MNLTTGSCEKLGEIIRPRTGPGSSLYSQQFLHVPSASTWVSSWSTKLFKTTHGFGVFPKHVHVLKKGCEHIFLLLLRDDFQVAVVLLKGKKVKRLNCTVFLKATGSNRCAFATCL